MATRLKSISDQPSFDLKANFEAMRFLPRFYREVKNTNRTLFFANMLGRAFSALTPVATLWVGKMIIDEIILQVNAPVKDLYQLWWLVGIELAILVVSDIINRLINLSDGLLGDQYSIDSSVLLINKTSEVELSQLEDSEFYDKLERARQQTTGRVGLLSNMLGQVQDLFALVTLIAGLIYFEPWLILLVVISIIPSFLNEIKFSNTSYSLSKSWTPERRELDYLRYIGANDKTAKELKLFGLANFIATRFKELSVKYYLENKKLSISRSQWGAFYNLIGTLSYYAAYVLIIYRVVSGNITIGDLTFLSGSFNKLKSRLEATFIRFTRISESALNLRDYFEFVDLKPNIDLQFEERPLPTAITQGFTFDDVKFSYPGSDTDVLKGVSFELKAGEKMAFVGENGAGKTTLIKLILRFYEPTSGRILLDGVDIRHFNKAAYQTFFGVIFQDFVKYELSIRDNIAVGKIDERENDGRIISAAESSLASEVVSEVKDGYDQQLGKRFVKGIELSGGQWQKIALARAYMKDAKVLILDEPTSALDARAEYEAFQRFIGLTKGKTSIIISHRFSTVRMADRILVLEDGVISELGTHEELIQHDKLYAELFDLQAAGYQ
ncbi:MAG: ABC transporter ATP-binding protein [Saprospiraceae bacterium]|nr:ABC transporter ATP-binding protein [Saprospiraceae bacterium]